MRGRGWCRTRMRRARLVSNAFLYTTGVETAHTRALMPRRGRFALFVTSRDHALSSETVFHNKC